MSYNYATVPASEQCIDVSGSVPFRTQPVDYTHNVWLGPQIEHKTKSILDEIRAPSSSIKKQYSCLTESTVQEYRKYPMPKVLKTPQNWIGVGFLWTEKYVIILKEGDDYD